MNIIRLFTNERYKGTPNYLRKQRYYELGRTILFFAICLSLFLAGIITTGSRKNLLTIVAILGCLPACKSAVTTIMFFRFKPMPIEQAARFHSAAGQMIQLFDRAFTSYEQNYYVDHLVVRAHTIVGYSADKAFLEAECQAHLKKILAAENIKDLTIKIFSDEKKYLARLADFANQNDDSDSAKIAEVLCQISL